MLSLLAYLLVTILNLIDRVWYTVSILIHGRKRLVHDIRRPPKKTLGVRYKEPKDPKAETPIIRNAMHPERLTDTPFPGVYVSCYCCYCCVTHDY
jgi:hypothetical protein